VPFLKFSRDKRGYENYYLFDGKGRPRLLFWFRTPPQVKVGRAPFSSDVRKMIEAQNPGVQFDWARIMSTPIPPPDVDYWRERRRAEKAAKRAAREADAEEAAQEAVQESAPADAPELAVDETGPREDIEAADVAVDAAEHTPPASQEGQPGQPSQGHRRRRRRRRRRGGGGDGSGGQMPPSQPDTPPDAEV
jgi:hypothetical protein